jgi:hypothetical protein
MHAVDLFGANDVLPSVIYSNPARTQAFFSNMANSSVNQTTLNIAIA